MADVKKNNDLYRVPENSLLDGILFLMTPEQKEYFLSSSAPNGLIYANKTPGFDYHLSVFLTPTAYKGLCEFLDHNQIDANNQPDQNIQSKIEILKADLEAGVRLKPNLSKKLQSNGKKETFVYIYSKTFEMACYIQQEGDEEAVFRATYIGPSEQAQAADDENDDEEIDLYNTLDSEESNDTEILDTDKITPKKINAKPKPFFPHIATTWHIYNSYTKDIKYFDRKAAEELVCNISNNNRLSDIHHSKNRHLKELSDTVKLSQLSMQYRYEINDIKEISEDLYTYELSIEDPLGEITNIKSAYVYDAEEENDYNSIEDNYRRIEKLLKVRLKKPAIIEYKGYQNGYYLFNSLAGQQIPAVGFLADMGLESKIKKEQDAIKCITAQNSPNHLIKLGTLLGDIKTEKLELFNLNGAQFELFDNLLSGNQKEAVAKALSTPDICLIQGPPGTGKTRVISEIVRQASRNDWKTLLVAPTHVAVDNVLEKIGFEDNISAIRCVNKDKLQELDEHIRQFSYDYRKESVINHSRKRVKKDIHKLEQERSKFNTLSKILKDLCTKYNIVEELKEKLKRRQNTLSSTEETVRYKFSLKVKNSKTKIIQTNNSLLESKINLDRSIQHLKDAVEHSGQFKSGNYTDTELKQIEQAVLEAEKLHGINLRKLQNLLEKTQDNIRYLNQKILLEKPKLQNTKTTLLQIDQGNIPKDVKDAVVKAVNSAASKCDNKIASNVRKLEYVQEKLRDNGHNNVYLKEQIEQTKQKLEKLNQNQLKHWWLKPFEAIWWRSLFNDYDLALSNYNAQLENSLKLIPSLKLKINDAAAVLEKSNESKNETISSAKKTEFKRQCNLYCSLYNEQIKELESLNKQLQDDNLAIPSLMDDIKSEKLELDRILFQAETNIKNSISCDLDMKTMNACDNMINCKKYMKVSYKISLEAHIESVKIEDEIIKTISDELGQLKLSIDTLKTDIAENSEQVNVLEKQAEDLLEEKPPGKMDAIEKIIDEISSKLERNKELLDFSQRWLEYLLRDSGLLSKHLAKYINLVCATTVGIASDEYFGDGKPLEQKQFDLLIVDEAGKVTEPEFLVAATRAKRWVIVGDHKQLPPYYDRKLNKIFSSVNRLRNSKDLPLLNSEPLQVSYFENLWKKLYFDTTESDKAKSRFVQLDVQRRMHPDLALFISDMFYDNQYTSPDGPEFIRKKTLKLSRFDHAVTLIEVCPGKNQNYFEINLSHSFERKKLNLPQQTGYANLEEAKKVIEVLTSILMEDSIYTEQQELNEENDSSAAIGIMAFYAGQVELIRRLIRDNKTLDAQELSGNGQFICKGSVTVVVNSVDSFQGKECSIIILSFTRSNPYHNIGFVDDANRLNVAMSRARKKLILIGDRNTFTRRAHTDDRNINGNDSESIKAERLFFGKLVEYIEGRGEIKKIFQLLEDDK